MNLWNKKVLPQPPVSTFKVLKRDINLKKLRDVCTQLRDFFEKNKYLHAEYLVLSRIVYRMKQKFRSSKDFKSLEKLYKALQRFFNINWAADIQTFLDLLPMGYTKETYLPTKNLLDFILVRLQSIVKLMERVVKTCKITSYLFNERLHTGQFWKIAFILFSLVSRVYILAKYITQHICKFYSKLLPYSEILKNSGIAWLPSSYIFPKNLEEWVNIEWIDSKKEITESEKFLETLDCLKMLKDDYNFLNLSDYSKYKGQNDDDDDNESLDEIIEVVDVETKRDEDSEHILLNTSYINNTDESNDCIEILDNKVNNEQGSGYLKSTKNMMDFTNSDEDDVGEVILEDVQQNCKERNINISNSNSKIGKRKKRKRKSLPIEENYIMNISDNSTEMFEKIVSENKHKKQKIIQNKPSDSKTEDQFKIKKKKLKNKAKQIENNTVLDNGNSKLKLDKKNKLIKQNPQFKGSYQETSMKFLTKSFKKNKRKRNRSNVAL